MTVRALSLIPLGVLAALASLSARPARAQAAATAASATVGAPRVPRAALVARIDSLAVAFLDEAPAAGLTLAVVRGRDTIVLRGYGWADSARHRAAGPTTIYRVGSITKQFTSAAILQLVEQGTLSLGDTLGRFLPAYPAWAHVTLRQLLGHTSGIPSYTSNAAWRRRLTEPLAPDTLLAMVARDTFDFAPGTRWRYDNTGYFLLGMVLEKVTGTPYARLVRDRFFTPLGMRSATYCPDAPTDTAYAAGYDRGPGGWQPTTPLSMTSPYAAGALCMSVPDFLRWQGALTGGRVVKPETYARMSRTDTLIGGEPTNYGWGLMPARIDGHRAVEHGGDINGFSTQQIWLPDDSLRVVVFTNTLGSNPDFLATNLAAAALGVSLRPSPRKLVAVPLPADLRAAAPGTFALQLPGGRVLALTLSDGANGLVAQATGQASVPLVYLGDSTFGAAFDPSMRLRVVVEGGRATKLVLRQGGATVEGPRQP